MKIVDNRDPAKIARNSGYSAEGRAANRAAAIDRAHAAETLVVAVAHRCSYCNLIHGARCEAQRTELLDALRAVLRAADERLAAERAAE